ncbi:MAG: PorV/PorQ family protein [bacterium]
MKKRFLILFFIFLIMTESYSQGFLSLKLGSDSRTAALGMAGTVLNEFGSTSYWNPAGLSFTKDKYLQFTHHRWIQGVKSIFLGFDQNSFGFHLLFTEVGGIEQRTVPSPEPESIFSFYELVFGVSYSRKVKKDISLGITLKGLAEKIYIESAFGIACDLGLQYEVVKEKLCLGAVIQNLGITGKLDKKSIELPASLRIGACYADNFIGTQFRLLMDGVAYKQTVHVHSGGELVLNDIFFIRAGYQSGYKVKGITAGMGIIWNSIGIDYSYMPIKRGLGDSHRVTCKFTL